MVTVCISSSTIAVTIFQNTSESLELIQAILFDLKKIFQRISGLSGHIKSKLLELKILIVHGIV